MQRDPEELLFSDRHGRRVQLDEVLTGGLEGQYADRVPALRRLMAAGADPEHRFWACYLLASWGDPEGLRQLAAWAADPGSAPWGDEPISRHRLDGLDESFDLLAEALRTSFSAEPTPELHAAQVAAAKALLGLAATHAMAILVGALVQEPAFVTEVTAELRAAVDGCVRAVAAEPDPPVGLVLQTIGLLGLLAEVADEPAAAAAERLIGPLAGTRWLAELDKALAVAGPHGAAVRQRLRGGQGGEGA